MTPYARCGSSNRLSPLAPKWRTPCRLAWTRKSGPPMRSRGRRRLARSDGGGGWGPGGPLGREDLSEVAVLQGADGRPAVETAARAGQEAELGALVDAPCGEDPED